MTVYNIEPIDPNIVFIVTIDDIPVLTGHGEPYRFVRRKDAENFVKNHFAQQLQRDEEEQRIMRERAAADLQQDESERDIWPISQEEDTKA